MLDASTEACGEPEADRPAEAAEAAPAAEDNGGFQPGPYPAQSRQPVAESECGENAPSSKFLSLDDYDCIGFDLDHTLCRYNIGPMIRLEYELLANFLVDKRGYDPSIKYKEFDADKDFICKGLTLDIEKGNLLRLGKDGYILAACHGTRKMTDIEIERVYGRCRKKHVASDYAKHLQKHGPLGMADYTSLVHSFMDYFDYPSILLCARIVDVLDRIKNNGKPMQEYNFWIDVLDGKKQMFTRTQFAIDQGGYFPEIKAHPEKFILKRRPEFRDWLKMLRENGKFLYVITGSHVDFASHVASYALGDDWKELFDIVIFFARKPSFFIDRRPFYKLSGEKEVESFTGWDELDTHHYYSQGNWHDLNEFFEYATEWEPSSSLYFGDNVLQDILAPNKFTKTCEVVAVSEELLAEGMVSHPASHNHAEDLSSSLWGSYFYCDETKKTAKSKVLERASSFANRRLGPDVGKSEAKAKAVSDEIRQATSLRRVSSLRVENREVLVPRERVVGESPVEVSASGSNEQLKLTSQSARCSPTVEVDDDQPPQQQLPKGPERINTLWGVCIRDHAKMCIPDLDILVDYPVDFKFPTFEQSESGVWVGSGFFPSDPLSLHTTTTSTAAANGNNNANNNPNTSR